jgi:hypothetical protein
LGHASAYAASRAAWAASGHVEHVFELAPLRPTARVGASYASGDSGGATYRAFDPMLPDAGVWHGAMALFTGSNEAEVNATVSAIPWADGVVAVEYRYVRLAVPGSLWRSDYLASLGSAPRSMDANLGHEVDAKVACNPWAPLDFELGYSALLVGGGARAILAASYAGSVPDVAQMAYVQAKIAF